jgi:hypothetical protein
MVKAGINDWGGVSPVMPDFINPEAPWPHLRLLEAATQSAGKRLVERLAIYPACARQASRWVDPKLQKAVFDRIDGDGRQRTDDWHPGDLGALPARETAWLRETMPRRIGSDLADIVAKAQNGPELDQGEVVRMFRAEEDEFMCIRRLQAETGGFTELVPLPFMESPIYLKGRAARPELPRGDPDARGRPPRAQSGAHQHPGLLGQARCRRRAPLPCGRRQRSPVNAHG